MLSIFKRMLYNKTFEKYLYALYKILSDYIKIDTIKICFKITEKFNKKKKNEFNFFKRCIKSI